MDRRRLLKTLVGTVSTLIVSRLSGKAKGDAAEARSAILLQSSSVAGFQFYEGERLWSGLCEGDELRLVPEPENIHDSCSVRVMRGDSQLGYLPRRENAAISNMLVANRQLTAKISGLRHSGDPWRRLTMDIFLTV